jgi:carbon-monoxide dehydrogenase small subunit
LIVKLNVNEEFYEVPVEPHETLLDVLRNRLNLTGVKQGCSGGGCGACTVLLDGRPAYSCMVFAARAEGKKVTTIEGLATGGRLHPVQRAFIEYGAVQCGYCTPGQVLTAKALLDTNLNPTREDVKEAILGNLCRCTGYVKIIKAILGAAAMKREGGGEWAKTDSIRILAKD